MSDLGGTGEEGGDVVPLGGHLSSVLELFLQPPPPPDQLSLRIMNIEAANKDIIL